MKLPVSRDHDSILVVCNRFLKILHFVAMTEKITAEELAKLFRDNVWKLYRLPESVILDRRPQFAAELMKELNEMLEIEIKLSMAFHPQTDGQIERTNQELEQYLSGCRTPRTANDGTSSCKIMISRECILIIGKIISWNSWQLQSLSLTTRYIQ